VAAAGPAEGENAVYLLPVEPGDRRTILTAAIATTRFARPVVSPSGQSVAYVGCAAAGLSCELWLQPLTPDFQRHGEPRRLMPVQGAVTGITWMPDERSLALGITESQGALSHLWRVPVAGGEPARLDWAGSFVQSPAASPSGRLAISTVASTAVDIWEFDLSTPGTPPRSHRVSSTLADVDPHFSPDGSKFAFGSARSGQGQEIWIAARNAALVIRRPASRVRLAG
jgi:Tol biopolymer transport system component